MPNGCTNRGRGQVRRLGGLDTLSKPAVKINSGSHHSGTAPTNRLLVSVGLGIRNRELEY